MGKKTEDELVKELASQLQTQFTRVWTHRKPSSSKKFIEKIEERLSYIPILQSETDLCVLLNDGRMAAVEIKLFKGDSLIYCIPFNKVSDRHSKKIHEIIKGQFGGKSDDKKKRRLFHYSQC